MTGEFIAKTPAICLVMIVRDEATIVRRCLDSVAQLIDAWLICDTGSVDGTPAIIEAHMAALGIPGEVIHEPWRDFGHNKSLVQRRAFSDGGARGARYLLWLDADEVLLNRDGAWPGAGDRAELLAWLDARPDVGIIYAETRYAHLRYRRWQIVRNDQLYEWRSPAHEYLVPSRPTGEAQLELLTVLARKQGNSSRDPERYVKYVAWLEAYLLEHPDAPRETYYLAQSYEDCGRAADAIDTFRKRIALGGYDQERYVSGLRLGRLLAERGQPAEAEAAWRAAYTEFPWRLEAARELMHLFGRERPAEAYRIARAVMSHAESPPPVAPLFAESDIADYKLLLDASVVAWYAGAYAQAYLWGKALLERPAPPDDLQRAQANMAWFEDGLRRLAAREEPADDSPDEAGALTTVICAVWHGDPDRQTLVRAHAANLELQTRPHRRIYVYDGGDAPPPELAGEVVTSRAALTIYEAWNLALALVKTPYVINLNLDDRLAPDALALLERALGDGAALAGGDWRVCYDQVAAEAVTPSFDAYELPFDGAWPPAGAETRLGSGSGERGTFGPAVMWRHVLHADLGRYPSHFADGTPIRVIADAIWSELVTRARPAGAVRLARVIGNYRSAPASQAEFRHPAGDEHALYARLGLKR